MQSSGEISGVSELSLDQRSLSLFLSLCTVPQTDLRTFPLLAQSMGQRICKDGMSVMGSHSSLQHLLEAQQALLVVSCEVDHEIFLRSKANL